MSLENSSRREECSRTRRNKPCKRAYHGLFIVDKPSGISSFEAVRRIRSRTGNRRAGHTGTLDPLATGVLPVCMGEATKLVPYLFSGKRRYHGEFLLGVETDTQDSTGTVISRKDATNVSIGQLENIVRAFTGIRRQCPPQFSAVKYKGKPSYFWARKGITVPLKEREIHIEELHITGSVGQQVSFDLLCSSGTYVRALVSEIGLQVGCGACITELRRVQCGPFLVESAIPLDRLETAFQEKCEDSWFWPMMKLLPELDLVYVEGETARKLQNGAAILHSALPHADQFRVEPGRKVKIIYNDAMIALGEFRRLGEHTMLQPLRILNTGN